MAQSAGLEVELFESNPQGSMSVSYARHFFSRVYHTLLSRRWIKNIEFSSGVSMDGIKVSASTICGGADIS